MIRAGIGGWTFAPWRGPFYPACLPRRDELAHASRQVTAIEINGTFYRTQSPASFRKWAEETPDGFVFALKGHRVVTNRTLLAEAGEAVMRFVSSGIAELGDKLGPINWQLAATKRFDPDDIEAFLKLLPRETGGLPLRHAVEIRHESFVTPDFVALARRHDVAIVFADSDEHPAIPDPHPISSMPACNARASARRRATRRPSSRAGRPTGRRGWPGIGPTASPISARRQRPRVPSATCFCSSSRAKRC